MKPETERFLGQAYDMLRRGDAMLGVALHKDVGRAAYLAGLHGAQALVFERASKVVRTHGGVQAEFYRLTAGDPAFGPELRSFLSMHYRLKSKADYAGGPDADVTPESARAALSEARRFVAAAEASLAATP